MSRVRLTIDRLVLKGFEPGQQKALAEALQGELRRVMAHGITTQSRRTAVLQLGGLPLETGMAGGRKLGQGVAGAIMRGLRR